MKWLMQLLGYVPTDAYIQLRAELRAEINRQHEELTRLRAAKTELMKTAAEDCSRVMSSQSQLETRTAFIDQRLLLLEASLKSDAYVVSVDKAVACPSCGNTALVAAIPLFRADRSDPSRTMVVGHAYTCPKHANPLQWYQGIGKDDRVISWSPRGGTMPADELGTVQVNEESGDEEPEPRRPQLKRSRP